MEKPKIVFIDWNNTLSKSKFWGHLESSSAKDLELFNKLERSLFINNLHLLKPWMKGSLSTNNMMDIIANDTKIDIDFVLNNFIKSCQEMTFVSEAIPELIKKIRNKSIKVYIATDNMDSFNRWTIPAMKLSDMFDGAINSFYKKALKIDFDEYGKSLFFGDFLKSKNINPQDTILIDDSEDKNGVLSSFGINYKRIGSDYSLENALHEIME